MGMAQIADDPVIFRCRNLGKKRDFLCSGMAMLPFAVFAFMGVVSLWRTYGLCDDQTGH